MESARRWRVVFAFLPMISAACSTVEATKATSAEPFIGSWVGSWRNQTNPAFNGEVDVEIAMDSENRPSGLRFTAKLTNATAPWFAATGLLRDGGLAFTAPGGTTLQFMLHGEDRIEATYYNPNNRESGTWNLRRRPR